MSRETIERLKSEIVEELKVSLANDFRAAVSDFLSKQKVGQRVEELLGEKAGQLMRSLSRDSATRTEGAPEVW